jgi:transposase
MKKKHLSKKQIEELAKMIVNGKTNAEVAEFYNISIATVNNHRTRLRRDGMLLPAKRGRKPKLESKSLPSITSIEKLDTTSKIENYQFIINGVSVSVSGKTKNVHIDKDAMIINF